MLKRLLQRFDTSVGRGDFGTSIGTGRVIKGGASISLMPSSWHEFADGRRQAGTRACCRCPWARSRL